MVYSHGKKFAYHPIKNPPSSPWGGGEGDLDSGQQQQSLSRLDKLGRSKSRSLFFLIFVLLVAYIVVSVLLQPEVNEDTADNVAISTGAYPPWLSALYNGSGYLPNESMTIATTSKVINTTTVTVPSSEESITTSTLQESTSQGSSSTSPPQSEEKVACVIPKLNPFDPSIKHLIKAPEPINCTDTYPLLFESFPNSSIVPMTKAIRANGYKTCCYRTISRRGPSISPKHPDDSYIQSPECYPMSLENATRVPSSHEYLLIACNASKNATKEKIVDLHVTTSLKPEVEQRVTSYYSNITSKKNASTPIPEHQRVNVVILGIDAVSHMNFIRTMPLTHSFLVSNLSAVGLRGFNKIGDNTYPNLAAVLTGLCLEQIKLCERNSSFDHCPFIWSRYASQGFRTSYGEDSTWMGIFNYLMRGFETPPTDYYLRPFGEAAEKLVGTHKRLNAKLCYGPRLSFQVLLGYMQKLAWTMGGGGGDGGGKGNGEEEKSRRYFQLIWATSLTHDYLNTGRHGDKHLVRFLQWFRDHGHLNRTVFILMSDHGIRWGEIRDYLQGQLEERLPFLYFMVPPWFRNKYDQAYRNLEKNVDRLTTPYDLHETLEDLLDLNRLEDKVVRSRMGNLPPRGRGISHFLPIPASRSCEDAGVSEHYCTCHKSKILTTENNAVVAQVANYLVYAINLMISKYSQCAYLALAKVKSALLISSDFNKWSAYQLVVQTRPGGAVFESSVAKDKWGGWKVSGTISRTNLYGNQSHCVEEKTMKLYCYCLDVLRK